ncbi:MAG TPA: ADP-glyceromanno-heptose 6-epimerase [Rhizomicrobium sp.]|nr:ADP-glyceromanno-heptose 6-epimerase [Rhizomicrobium sp.]
MIIVTGGAGFIGSNILAALETRRESRIVACDWLGNGEKWRNVARRGLWDIVLPERLFAYLDAHAGEIEAVFHMGAISTTTEQDVDLIVKNNFRLSADLLEWCAAHGVRMIYASSAATYGGGELGFSDKESEDHLAALKPLNAYGWSKNAFDRLVARRRSLGLSMPPQFAGLKFFNVYGPNEYHKGDQQSVVAHIYRRFAEGGTYTLFRSHRPGCKDGEQLRDFVHVKDCVDVMMWLLDNPHVAGLFNLGSGKARSFLDLARAVYRALGVPERIEFIDMPEQLRGKYQYFTQADMSKLRTAGYSRPATSLEDGVTDYVTRYLATDDPYA